MSQTLEERVGEEHLHIAEFEIFAREWDAAERSRHSRLLEQLKREYRESPRGSSPAETMIDVPYSVRLPQSVPHQRVSSQGRPKEAQPLPRLTREPS